MANKTVRSVCPYCGVGCGIVMQVENNKVVKVVGDKTHPTNFGRLCTKGTTCGQAIAESGRMENAYLRQERDRDPVRVAMDTGHQRNRQPLARRSSTATAPMRWRFTCRGRCRWKPST